ncbi:FkbM family methyltransferase [Streptosporangium longisporum]|uniref:Methyltransferase FkbM domain-containing protein n=1 Tax=Streptosporangium longisporum TaxID=46187 RepID=A0ABN3XSA5_9ACTN
MSMRFRPGVAVRSAVAGAVPPRWFGAAIRRVYPRLDAELARAGEFVPRGGTAVDVGVWYGPWTAALRRLASEVVSIEANPRLAALLTTTFPDVRVVAAAASDRSGTARLWIPGGGRGAEATASVVHGQGVPVDVPAVTIDELDLRDVRFMKIDVEGHELAALLGAERTVRRDRPVLLIELETRHQDIGLVVDRLAGWGYTGSVLTGGSWRPLDGFDLPAHQEEAVGEVRRSFISRLLVPGREYVNMVLFRPAAP